ncbi:hypothetical protein HJFPF1_09371 [Paramyrothecium foliicola]|nr:hypothetical protein HJFPF1_09371 [Paramyrothecium foliicola]
MSSLSNNPNDDFYRDFWDPKSYQWVEEANSEENYSLGSYPPPSHSPTLDDDSAHVASNNVSVDADVSFLDTKFNTIELHEQASVESETPALARGDCYGSIKAEEHASSSLEYQSQGQLNNNPLSNDLVVDHEKSGSAYDDASTPLKQCAESNGNQCFGSAQSVTVGSSLCSTTLLENPTPKVQDQDVEKPFVEARSQNFNVVQRGREERKLRNINVPTVTDVSQGSRL